MLPDYLFTARAEAFRRELYRNPNTPVVGVDLWGPKPPSWRETLWLEFGNLLIAIGTHIKATAQPRAVLSKELL